MFTFKSIKNSFIFWFSFVAILPLIIVSVVVYHQRVKDIKYEESQKLSAIRDLKAQHLEIWLGERSSDISTLAENSEIRDLEDIFKNHAVSPEEVYRKKNEARDVLVRYLRSHKDYGSIFIINERTGNIVISTDKVTEGQNRSEELYYTEPRRTKKMFIKDIYYSKILNKYTMAFAAPVWCLPHRGKHFIAVVVARVNLDQSLYPILMERTGLGKTGETYIVNKEMEVLTRLRKKPSAPLRFKIKTKHALLSSEEKEDIIESVDYRGEKVLAAFTFIDTMQWGFVVKQDIDEVYAPIKLMIRNMGILLGISIIGVNLTAIFITKSITRPLLDMTEVSKRIQMGDLTARNYIKRQDELGYLASSFNSLADFMMSQITMQKSVAAINEAIATSRELQDFAVSLLKMLYEITGSHLCAYHMLSENEQLFEHSASIGINASLLQPFDSSSFEGEFGKALLTQKITHIKDIDENTAFTFKTFAGTVLPKEIITIPIVVNDKTMAVISLASLTGYSTEILEFLDLTWMNMNTAYVGLLVNEKTKRLAVALRENNRQLEIQSEELKAKSDELCLKTHKLEAQTEELEAQSEELRQQNAELDKQRIQVEEANRLKSEFLSTMSHELRTPLNSIIALSRVLIMKSSMKMSEDEKKYLEIIDRNGKRLLELINDILDLSKIEAGRIELKIKSFSLKTIIQSIAENLFPVVHQKKIGLEMDIQKDLPDIESDEERVHQVLTNIMNNAVKFTNKGKVTVTCKQKGEDIAIQVEDTGIGIKEKDLKHIFEEFRQVDSTPSREYEGTGLGLAIVKRALKLLRGKVSVKSTFGVGSTFTVVLPIKWHNPNEVNKSNSRSFIQERSRGNKIVLIEDNETAIIQIKAFLEKEGYELQVAQGVHEALKILNESVPDGIILDLMMPDGDGFEVLKTIRHQDTTKHVPVLVLTAKDLTNDDIRLIYQQNVQHLIQKGDIDAEGLIERLSQLVRGPNRFKSNKLSLKQQKQEDNRKPNVLIVEDNRDNLTTINAILRDKYNILEATDGKQGLQIANTFLPDIILLDISLPGIDGFNVIQRLKENEQTRFIPIIAVTAHAMKGDREKIIQTGCDGYIAKPVDPLELENVIKKWLNNGFDKKQT